MLDKENPLIEDLMYDGYTLEDANEIVQYFADKAVDEFDPNNSMKIDAIGDEFEPADEEKFEQYCQENGINKDQLFEDIGNRLIELLGDVPPKNKEVRMMDFSHPLIKMLDEKNYFINESQSIIHSLQYHVIEEFGVKHLVMPINDTFHPIKEVVDILPEGIDIFRVKKERDREEFEQFCNDRNMNSDDYLAEMEDRLEELVQNSRYRRKGKRNVIKDNLEYLKENNIIN